MCPVGYLHSSPIGLGFFVVVVVCFEKGINYIGFYSFSHSLQLFFLLCCPMYIPLLSPEAHALKEKPQGRQGLIWFDSYRCLINQQVLEGIRFSNFKADPWGDPHLITIINILSFARTFTLWRENLWLILKFPENFLLVKSACGITQTACLLQVAQIQELLLYEI